MKKIAVLAAMLAATGWCGGALAYESGGFVRAEIGNSKFDIDAGGVSDDSDDNGFGFRGGYYFNPFFAVEGFYARYGQDDDNGVESTFDGFGAGVVGKYNFGADYDGFYVAGRAGLARIRTDVDAGGLGSWDAGDTTPYLGVGVGYDFSYDFGVGLNYDYAKPEFDVAGGSVDVKVRTLTLDVEYRF